MPEPSRPPIDPSLLGQRLSGDLGGFTYYQTRRGKTVAYPAAPPTKPPSIHQLRQRLRFAQASRNWTAAAQQVRLDYEACSLRCSLPATGLNLWVWLSFEQNPYFLETLNRESGLNLPMPPPV